MEKIIATRHSNRVVFSLGDPADDCSEGIPIFDAWERFAGTNEEYDNSEEGLTITNLSLAENMIEELKKDWRVELIEK